MSFESAHLLWLQACDLICMDHTTQLRPFHTIPVNYWSDPTQRASVSSLKLQEGEISIIQHDSDCHRQAHVKQCSSPGSSATCQWRLRDMACEAILLSTNRHFELSIQSLHYCGTSSYSQVCPFVHRSSVFSFAFRFLSFAKTPASSLLLAHTGP